MSGPLARTPRWGRLFSLVPLTLLVVSACSGDQPAAYTGAQSYPGTEKTPAGGLMKNFELVGTNPFLDSKFNIPRGNNGGITAVVDAKGAYIYIGTDDSIQPGLVVDFKDPKKPTVVGEVPTLKGKSIGRESIEAVGDLNLLAVSVNTSEYPNLKASAAEANVGLMVYDISERTKPTIVAKVDVFNGSTHYMTLWRDPKKPDRVMASISYSGSPEGVDIRVYDLTGCPKSCNPKLAGEWGLRAQLGIPQNVTTQYEGGTRVDGTTTHDHTWSIDGTRIHMAQTRYGYLQIDSSAIANGTNCDVKAATNPNAFGSCLSVIPGFQPLPNAFQIASTHGVVKIPGRPYVMLAHEGYQCPYGGITMAFVGDQNSFSFNTYDMANKVFVPGQGGSVGAFRADLQPRTVGTFFIPEQQPDRCPKPSDQIPATTGQTGIYGLDVMANAKSVHDIIAFPNIAFATWYGAGLRAIDISNPLQPYEVGFFFPKAAPEVRWCNSQGGACGDVEVDAEGLPVRQKNLTPPQLLAKSYPITVNGYVVFSDNNFGMYVLKYKGPHANEIPAQGQCIAKQPNTVAVGFEPCAPYK